jgi:hypothetical protein
MTLEQLKKQEQPIAVIVLTNYKLCDFLVAWQNANIQYAGNLWQGCNYDMEEVAKLSDLSIGDATGVFQRLKGLGLIYPDGTINSFANKFLIAKAKSTIKNI